MCPCSPSQQKSQDAMSKLMRVPVLVQKKRQFVRRARQRYVLNMFSKHRGHWPYEIYILVLHFLLRRKWGFPLAAASGLVFHC